MGACNQGKERATFHCVARRHSLINTCYCLCLPIMYCTVLYCTKIRYSTVHRGGGVPPNWCNKNPETFLSDYKLPLAPKREFLAIPNGWRRNCKSCINRHYLSSDGLCNDDHKRATEKNFTWWTRDRKIIVKKRSKNSLFRCWNLRSKTVFAPCIYY